MRGMWGCKDADEMEEVSMLERTHAHVYRDPRDVGWLEWANNRVYDSTIKFVVSLTVFLLTTGSLLLAWHLGCKTCILVVVIVSLCLCLCMSMPYLSLPILVGVVMLWLLGWTLGDGAMRVEWTGALGGGRG